MWKDCSSAYLQYTLKLLNIRSILIFISQLRNIDSSMKELEKHRCLLSFHMKHQILSMQNRYFSLSIIKLALMIINDYNQELFRQTEPM